MKHQTHTQFISALNFCLQYKVFYAVFVFNYCTNIYVLENFFILWFSNSVAISRPRVWVRNFNLRKATRVLYWIHTIVTRVLYWIHTIVQGALYMSRWRRAYVYQFTLGDMLGRMQDSTCIGSIQDWIFTDSLNLPIYPRRRAWLRAGFHLYWKHMAAD